MATISEIKKQLTDAFIADSNVQTLYSLDTSKNFDEQFSKVSIESILFYVVAYVVWLRETALASWSEDVQQTALTTRYGTKQWWHAKALAWQEGYATCVLEDGTSVGYATQDTTKQMVKYCAVSQSEGIVLLKVAGGTQDKLQPLNSDQMTMFNSYLNDIKPLGINVVAKSMAADSLTIAANIYYDTQLLQSDVDSGVKDAIETLLKNIKFGGVIYKSQIVDAIQGVKGVRDVELTQMQAGVKGQSTPIHCTHAYTPEAGWAVVGGWGLVYYGED